MCKKFNKSRSPSITARCETVSPLSFFTFKSTFLFLINLFIITFFSIKNREYFFNRKYFFTKKNRGVSPHLFFILGSAFLFINFLIKDTFLFISNKEEAT